MAPRTNLIAIRVQDVTNQKWYNWDNGSWDSNGQPKCVSGGKLYVAAYAVNEGDAGTAGISISYGGYVQQQSGYLTTGQSIQLEANYVMPAQGNIKIGVADSTDVTEFTVASTGEAINWLMIAGVAGGLIALGAVVYLIRKRR
jgi:LPXTG-motif cell wall-anchored protein